MRADLPKHPTSNIKYQIMKTTLKNMAEASGVDISTVSRALRNDSRVKETTRKTIQKLAKKMGYSPNLAARSLVAGKTRTIWFMVPSLCHTLEQIPAQHAAIYLNDKNYDLLVALHHNDEETYRRQISRLTQGVADGVIIIPGPTEKGGAYVKSLLDQKYPVVFLDRHPAGVKAPCVVTDNHQAAFDMISISHKNGTKAVIDICSTNINNSSLARSKGILVACKQFNIQLLTANEQNLITEKLPTDLTIIGSGQSQICDFLHRNPELAHKKKLLVCCFDQWFGAPYPAEKVIIAKQNFTTMAEKACDILLEMINGKKVIDKVKVPIKKLKIIESGYGNT
jgi:LacI family transcriptional regulator, galactose operon repressor